MKVYVNRKFCSSVPLDQSCGLADIHFDQLFQGKISLEYKKEKDHLILVIKCDGVEYVSD